MTVSAQVLETQMKLQSGDKISLCLPNRVYFGQSWMNINTVCEPIFLCWSLTQSTDICANLILISPLPLRHCGGSSKSLAPLDLDSLSRGRIYIGLISKYIFRSQVTQPSQHPSMVGCAQTKQVALRSGEVRFNGKFVETLTRILVSAAAFCL